MIFHKCRHGGRRCNSSFSETRRIRPAYLRERERENGRRSLSRPPEAWPAETDDSLSLSLSVSRASIPVTAEWLRRNCREVRSAGGFYQRSHRAQQHEKMHSADGRPRNSLSPCITVEPSGLKRTSWKQKNLELCGTDLPPVTSSGMDSM